MRDSEGTPLGSVEIAVLGDIHGSFDIVADLPLLTRYPVRVCTGDLVPNHGSERFRNGLRVAGELASCQTYTILGNHDGPTCFTGRTFPQSYEQLALALGEWHLSARRVDFPEHDLSLVGARPLTCGGPGIRFRVPGREDWTLERWAEEIESLVKGAPCGRVVILAHCGPTGLGAARADIYGCDFRADAGDWGDADLRQALDAVRPSGRVRAVIAGHMHHELVGGGTRTSSVREDGVLHLNAAVVPRVRDDGRRALHVLTLTGAEASARLEWHSPSGEAVEVAPA